VSSTVSTTNLEYSKEFVKSFVTIYTTLFKLLVHVGRTYLIINAILFSTQIEITFVLAVVYKHTNIYVDSKGVDEQT
jgi:hypothetical protein